MAYQEMSAGDGATPGSAAQTGLQGLHGASTAHPCEAFSFCAGAPELPQGWRAEYAREAVADIEALALTMLECPRADVGSLQRACLVRILDLAEVAIASLGDEIHPREDLHRRLTGLPLVDAAAAAMSARGIRRKADPDRHFAASIIDYSLSGDFPPEYVEQLRRMSARAREEMVERHASRARASAATGAERKSLEIIGGAIAAIQVSELMKRLREARHA